MILNEKHVPGDIVLYDNCHYLVTALEFFSDEEIIAGEEDALPFLGWNSYLVTLDSLVMEALSKQYHIGQVTFPTSETVRFFDEGEEMRLSDLAYSSELGLYNIQHF